MKYLDVSVNWLMAAIDIHNKGYVLWLSLYRHHRWPSFHRQAFWGCVVTDVRRVINKNTNSYLV